MDLDGQQGRLHGSTMPMDQQPRPTASPRLIPASWRFAKSSREPRRTATNGRPLPSAELLHGDVVVVVVPPATRRRRRRRRGPHHQAIDTPVEPGRKSSSSSFAKAFLLWLWPRTHKAKDTYTLPYLRPVQCQCRSENRSSSKSWRLQQLDRTLDWQSHRELKVGEDWRSSRRSMRWGVLVCGVLCGCYITSSSARLRTVVDAARGSDGTASFSGRPARFVLSGLLFFPFLSTLFCFLLSRFANVSLIICP